jgi:hypothetical protein
MRQANAILQTKQDKRKTKQNCLGFKFKPHQVNDSSQSNQGTDQLVSQFRRALVLPNGKHLARNALEHFSQADNASLLE